MQSHNSVAQRNVIISTILRPQHWVLLGIDLKRVELTQFRDFGVNVATNMEDAALFTRFVQSTMMARYTKMEKAGINNYEDFPDNERGPALMLMVDELGELLAPIPGKSEEAKEQQAFQEEVTANLASIARLGRAAQVFMLLATQKPSADILPTQIRDNLGNRVVCGGVTSSISQMMLESNFGARIPGNPMGRIGIKISSSEPIMGQGFFAPEDWLDNYFEKFGGFKPEQLEAMEDMAEIEAANAAPPKGPEKSAEQDWDEAMDEIYEVSDGIEL